MKGNLGKLVLAAERQAVPSTKSLCAICGREFFATEFYSRVNLVEYIISGMCQRCQDEALEDGK